MWSASPRTFAGLLACLCACPSAPGDDTGAGESSGTTGEPVPVPAFVNPAVGTVRIASNQTEPETLVVHNILPGVTQVLLDGYSLGALDEPSSLGSLEPDLLSLTLGGALIAGSHTLRLLTASPDGPLYSVELELKIQAPAEETRPLWTAELDPKVLATGTILLSSGVGAGGLLGLVSPAEPDPELRLWAADADGWSSAEPVWLPLEGHVLQGMSFAPSVTAIAFPEPDGASPKRMRAVYSVGLPGFAVHTRDIQIDPSPIVFDPVVAFDLDAALGDAQLEYAAFGRPVALGHTIVAELHAAADAEQPHPGDHRLITSFWRGPDLRWTPPQQIGTATPGDLDSLGPAPVLADIPNHSTVTLSVRLGGAFPGVLELRDTGAISLTTPPLSAPLDVTGDITLATILGNFGSRTVAAVDREGRVSLSLLETSKGNVPRKISPKATKLPVTPATGPLAPGIGRGFPFFLVPYGDAAPVHVIASDGNTHFVAPLPDLHCDTLALAVTLAGNDPEDAALPLACLADGELRLGVVRIELPTPVAP